MFDVNYNMIIGNINQTSFGNLTKTEELMETILQKNFKSDGTESVKKVMQDIYPNTKAIGRYKGYAYYAKKIKDLALNQYPQLASDIKAISKHIEQNPQISKKELAEFIHPYINKYGKTIDIKV